MIRLRLFVPGERTRQVKKYKPKLPNFLTENEAEQVLQACRKSIAEANTPCRRRRARRDLTMIMVGLYAGLRVSEICALEVGDVDLQAMTLLVRRGKGNKQRLLPLAKSLHEQLTDWIGNRTSGLIFLGRDGRVMHKTSFADRLEAIGKRAGLRKKLKAHTLRHSFCTRLLERGADLAQIKDLAGHAGLSSLQVYLHVTPDRLRGAVDKL